MGFTLETRIGNGDNIYISKKSIQNRRNVAAKTRSTINKPAEAKLESNTPAIHPSPLSHTLTKINL
jgi:hypothetical protein